MIIGSCLSIQVSHALATTAFGTFGPVGTSALRFLLAAVLLLAIIRPAIRGHDTRFWVLVITLGTVVAALNLAMYAAIDRIPLGTAVAVQFLGPLVLAVAASRRRLDVAWAVLAAAGVLLVTGGLTLTSLPGIGFAVASGACWAVYLLTTRRIGSASDSFDGLALAITASAIVTAPWAVTAAVGDPAVDVLLLVLGLAVIGVAVPYALEYAALRRLGVRMTSVLLSLEPAVAAGVGLLVLSQRLSLGQALGVVLVTVASIGVVLTARSVPPVATPPAP